jgi:hypothetical protein
MLKCLLVLLLALMPATVANTEIHIAGGKMYQGKGNQKKIYGTVRPLTRTQKIQQGLIKEPKMVTCRLKSRKKTKSGEEVCIYQGQNKTYEMAIERNCPKQYKCKYNPYGEEPNIGSVIDSLNEAVK